MRQLRIPRFFRSNSRKWKFILCFVMVASVPIYILIWKSPHEDFGFSPHIQYYADLMDGYLVNSSKCRMPSIPPLHSNITPFVKKFEIEECSTIPLLSSIMEENDQTFSLVINATIIEYYGSFICCWAPIFRPKPTQPLIYDLDSIVNKGNCENFENKVVLPSDLEVVMVSCRANTEDSKILYENIHAIINPAKVQNRQDTPQSVNKDFYRNYRKMSILILGIDSVSRLNFLRSLPITEKYLRGTGWFSLNGYNKMGDNTFPNLMAILTGHSESTMYSRCKPEQTYGMDQCPLVWYGYREAGYVTAYGEDWYSGATFTFRKPGFVNPPTDYYLRPYVVAVEKFLKGKYEIGNHYYCTGPEATIKRIFSYASNFANTFFDVPYFGFFWINTISHDSLNGISSMDTYLRNYFEDFERQGIFNDTMVIFLSDHGMRFGDFRETFAGWYEERLPFVYLRFPQGYPQSSEIHRSLKLNENRLTSPYDLYETLRDILMKSSEVEINPSVGCPSCQTLFQPVPKERSCEDAGILPHWCTCAITEPTNEAVNGTIANNGVQAFLNYVDNIIMQYKNKKGERLCAQLQLKKIHHINQIMEMNENIEAANKKYSLRIEVKPGDAMFEFAIYMNQNGSFTVLPEQISRINSYIEDGKCLDHGNKKYCYCLN